MPCVFLETPIFVSFGGKIVAVTDADSGQYSYSEGDHETRRKIGGDGLKNVVE